MEHRYKIIYDKLLYVYEHSGDGATVHEAGHLSGLLFNYNSLIEKETENPIMGIETMNHYKSQMDKYLKQSESFLKKIASIVQRIG